MKKLSVLLIAVSLVATMAFTGCDKKKMVTNKVSDNNEEDTAGTDISKVTPDYEKVEFTNFDKRDTWGTDAVIIKLADEDVIIEKEGTYILSGTLKNGQIYVNVDATEKVQLVLKGVDITCESSAAIFVENADKVAITLAKGTENTLTDGGNADSSNADGCIYSKDDLTINGEGKLIVNGKVNNGIDCNNDLRIVSGTIEVNAVNNGIKAKESIAVKDGDIKVYAEDAIKTEDKSDESVGSFYMEGGKMELEATDDGITAKVSLTVTGGEITIDAEGKNTNCDGKENIAEGCLIKK